MSGSAASENGDVRVLLLHAEAATLSKRVRKTLVRAARKTSMREVCVEAELAHDHVVVERVPIGRVVDAAPPIRQEGDVTILPVMEEIVVLERRLVLKEEVHFRRVQTMQRFSETVSLREQTVTVTRTDVTASEFNQTS